MFSFGNKEKKGRKNLKFLPQSRILCYIFFPEDVFLHPNKGNYPRPSENLSRPEAGLVD